MKSENEVLPMNRRQFFCPLFPSAVPPRSTRLAARHAGCGRGRTFEMQRGPCPGPGDYEGGGLSLVRLLRQDAIRSDELLCSQQSGHLRAPHATASDRIKVSLIDLKDGDCWTELGSSDASCRQHGCMLQWVPGSKNEVLWNLPFAPPLKLTRVERASPKRSIPPHGDCPH